MTTIPDKALALLERHRDGTAPLTRAAGSFCGELVVDPRPLTEKQAAWFSRLIEKAGLPALADGDGK
jgi:hypothetical protein